MSKDTRAICLLHHGDLLSPGLFTNKFLHVGVAGSQRILKSFRTNLGLIYIDSKIRGIDTTTIRYPKQLSYSSIYFKISNADQQKVILISNMGNSQGAVPQVRERHAHALYINVPVNPEALISAGVVVAPARPALYDGTAWISIVVDDLRALETPFGGGFIGVPGMNGWMMKSNVLVDCPKKPDDGDDEDTYHGYQIITLDFEQTIGLSGWTKKVGAVSTQKIPAYLSSFSISCGASKMEKISMEEGTSFSAFVLKSATGKGDDNTLVSLMEGTLQPIQTEEERSFVKFVTDRPHKFLLQQSSKSAAKTLVYASWRKYSSSADEVMHVKVDSTQLLLPVLKARLPVEVVAAIEISKCICFLQPEYRMIDYTNSPVDW